MIITRKTKTSDEKKGEKNANLKHIAVVVVYEFLVNFHSLC
jgi:hypothetical protein